MRPIPEGVDPTIPPPGPEVSVVAPPAGDELRATTLPPAPPAPPRPASWAPRWPTRRIFGAAFTAGTAVVLAYVLLTAIGGVAGELILIVLALVFALGLDPMVSWLVRHGSSRGLAVAGGTVGFLLVGVGGFAVIIPPIVAQVEQLIHAAPGLIQQLQDRSSVLGR